MSGKSDFFSFAPQLKSYLSLHRKLMRNSYSLTVSKFGLLIVTVLYLGSINFFHHIHKIDDTMILHSHPYKKGCDGKPAHTHTKTELQLIQHLSAFEIIDLSASIIDLSIPFVKPVILLTNSGVVLHFQYQRGCFLLRPPPFL